MRHWDIFREMSCAVKCASAAACGGVDSTIVNGSHCIAGPGARPVHVKDTLIWLVVVAAAKYKGD